MKTMGESSQLSREDCESGIETCLNLVDDLASLRQWMAWAVMCYWPTLMIFHWRRFEGNLRASPARIDCALSISGESLAKD